VPFGGSVVEVAADADGAATAITDTAVATTANRRTNEECRVTAASYERDVRGNCSSPRHRCLRKPLRDAHGI